ncbi:bifunctional riboflavin kinase/FAD synthetase [Prochlorococcus sp. MIT 1307]|uniref:bifunctional riboflavin kinase/FAD synthetase n=1 Tax=Prochlorococcus sp. MIT 1307 TaxID=3096219 RepID=UPI002A75228B|nr:bifunctional riboflavin kinase/FAD synthetase [Prochlorococcus sp. MIT 1307]
MIPLCSPKQALLPTALALGSFDGLHAGHRRVIERITRNTPGIPTVVSFWPHPREVLYGEARLRLDLPSEKTSLLEPLGVEQLVLIPFDKSLAALTPDKFVNQILLETLQAKHIAVGANFRFGKNREGDVFTLEKIGATAGIKVSVVPILEDNEGRMSSSRIRSALNKGELKTAQKLMGRAYRFRGSVVSGRGIGRGIGWPTANLQVDGRKFLPGQGVYAAWAWKPNKDNAFSAVMNLGPQPTVDPTAPSAVEVHLLDKDLDLTGQELIVEPVQKLRSQKQFTNLVELSAQIGRDAKLAKTILESIENHLGTG